MQVNQKKKDGVTYNKTTPNSQTTAPKERLVSLFTYQHPGYVLKSCLKSHKLAAKEFAERADIEIGELTKILNAKAPVTEDVAIKIAKFFDSNAQNWLNRQAKYESTRGAK